MISIIYDYINWEEKQIIKKLQEENIEYNIINAKDEPLNITGKNSKIGDVAFIRCVSHRRSLYYSAILENQGIRTINSFNIFNITGNKIITSAYLYKNNIPTPESTVSFSKDAAIGVCNSYGYPVVFKPASGSWGRMVSLIKNDNMAETIFSMNDMVNESGVYYIQRYVERPPRDIRAILINHDISAAVYRYSNDGWKTNLYLGGKVEKAALSDYDREIIIKASEIFDAGVIGIDAMESPDGIKIHEINGRVEFKGASRVYGDKIINDVVNFLKSTS
ncbi:MULTISPECIES: RimK family alpha-L-glutamate ligase [Acidiplasma]|jgi:[lysine-biosynthesis-protein LysW]--L-2-aminoadipate ligase/ribosomal protein S6--L-glutamate ligase|uniref:ATP-grasp domain-containing protein n=1 Tax=Acidiplasma aeolicum TaxID=507754 RepID=A0A0P9GZR7_9ARCH|nr:MULTISPECIES: RimK family alpha-L-glutamate ligase [Acidiplasma]KPV47190.1 hypothetical protein SE19_02150 [Acidiplasma aeolicum]